MEIGGDYIDSGGKKMNDDWRLNDYLIGCCFEKKEFHSSKKNDHEHCEFCGLKITDVDIKEEHILCGYVTVLKQSNQEHWICPRCFSDFKNKFKFYEKVNRNDS